MGFIGWSQPANDNCSGATSITPDGTCQNGTTTNANDDWSGEVGCATAGGANRHKDVWYSFVATDQQFDITVTDISVGANLEIILVQPTTQPCSGPFGVLASFCGGSPVTGSYTGLVIGNTYYYTISAPGNAEGDFQHCVDNTTPASTSNQDCFASTAVCGNTSFSGNSSGSGAVAELNSSNDGCLNGEHQSSWYTFTVLTSGTLDITISPQNGTDDYDFALWGPSSVCPPLSSPIRCSYAAGGGDTGLGNGAADVSEGAFGNKWVASLSVTVGETYTLLIDNYSSTTSPFDLSWGGSSTLDCSAVLPIELTVFKADHLEGYNLITWVTESEINNSHFELERSTDGMAFERIAILSGMGNSTLQHTYTYKDQNYLTGLINYYRLKQVDFDGVFEYFDIISVDNTEEEVRVLKTINLLGQPVDVNYKGIVIDYKSDGSTTKRFQ
ncbi:MAG: hypothetical protein KDC84_05935 [Crocinitomicaceae bacterium]|nr:hypothetical protein [Crocinitomicaceae bacterium]